MAFCRYLRKLKILIIICLNEGHITHETIRNNNYMYIYEINRFVKLNCNSHQVINRWLLPNNVIYFCTLQKRLTQCTAYWSVRQTSREAARVLVVSNAAVTTPAPVCDTPEAIVAAILQKHRVHHPQVVIATTNDLLWPLWTLNLILSPLCPSWVCCLFLSSLSPCMWLDVYFVTVYVIGCHICCPCMWLISY